MGKIADAFERQRREYERDKVFILRNVEVNGELREAHTTDDSITNLLTFRGTGSTKKFSDILVEYINYCDWWNNTLWDTGKRPTKDNPWLDSWIIQKNYRVLYEPGDITISKTSKMGVAS